MVRFTAVYQYFRVYFTKQLGDHCSVLSAAVVTFEIGPCLVCWLWMCCKSILMLHLSIVLVFERRHLAL